MRMQKKVYNKPSVEVERYELNKSIASNCALVVSNGPALGEHNPCEDYVDPFAETGVAMYSVYNVSFYEDTNCDCYYSASDMGYWTS